jgi:hypothetical protein
LSIKSIAVSPGFSSPGFLKVARLYLCASQLHYLSPSRVIFVNKSTIVRAE